MKKYFPGNMLDATLEISNVVIKDIAVGARGLGIYNRAGQIGRSVASGSPPLRSFFVVVLFRRYAAQMDSAAHHMLLCNDASIMKV